MKKRFVWVFVAVALSAALSGCTFFAVEVADKPTCGLELYVSPSMTAKAITVEEVEVTGLLLQVFDASGDEVDFFEWDPGDGRKKYTISVEEAGEYVLQVTHYGEGVEVSESAGFELTEMMITVIEVVPGLIGCISIDPGPGQGGATADEIFEAALAVMYGLYEASLRASGGTGELPDGITLDMSGVTGDGGTMYFIFDGYVPPGTEGTVTGTITIEFWWIESEPVWIDETISGELSLTGLGFETFVIDLDALFPVGETGPDSAGAELSGSVTLDGYEVDVDELMSVFWEWY